MRIGEIGLAWTINNQIIGIACDAEPVLAQHHTAGLAQQEVCSLLQQDPRLRPYVYPQ